MSLDPTAYSWTINLAVVSGSGINLRLSDRNRVIHLLISQGFKIVVEPENPISALRIRATHTKKSAITLFLLNRPNSVESVDEYYTCG